MSNMTALYQKALLEHNRNPQNTGMVPESTHSLRELNPLCGDRVDLSLRIDNGVLCEVRCDTKGCALCVASASLMTLALVKLAAPDAIALCERIKVIMAEPVSESNASTSSDSRLPEDLLVFLPVRTSPSRIGCITLPWQAVVNALGSKRKA